MEIEKRKAGRPEGSLNRIAREAREAAKLSGKLPHEILLDMARGEPQPIKTAEEDAQGNVVVKTIAWQVPDMEQMKDAAKAAAPYFAPKISTVEVIAGVNDHDLDSIIAQLAAETGISLGAHGEGQEGEEEAGSTAPAATGNEQQGSEQPTGIRRRPVTRP